ncbi:unnamed protein product [Oppiella nova]|uniref:UBC core domain-containing protein n=1 Tax=Oppiella nova TaxID=334625 RepID=A0A7R9LIP5_9ACAR|nr:unnamed protein product [Oppiella nova]CAG2163366.1 unnamed protein product [Oppiella nova]
MDSKISTELVLRNPYLIARIVSELDIRSLFTSHCLSKDFFYASAYEYEKRKHIIHLYLLNHQLVKEQPIYDSQRLIELFKDYNKRCLDMRPKHVLVLIGGYRQPIDYRRKENSVRHMSAGLPTDCDITYLDVGKILASSIRTKSLLNFGLTSLLIPDIDGIEVRSYHSLQDVDTKDVSSILFFESSRVRDRTPKGVLRDTQTVGAINGLISRLDRSVSFGGGSVVAAKTLSKCPLLLDHIILTFGGHRVRTGSAVISTSDPSTYLSQLLHFRNSLDFDCNDYKNSTSIAIIFANSDNFSFEFTTEFQSVFPFVGMFGFQTKGHILGKPLVSKDTTDELKDCIENIKGMAAERLRREYKDFMSDPNPFATVAPTDNLLVWKVFLNGPKETPYEGGMFEIELRFPANYPTRGPDMRFITQIFHANIHSNAIYV